MDLRFLDVPAALFRVSHAGLGLFDDSLEDSFPSLVERSDGDSTKQAFRRDEVPPACERPGLVDVPLERERLDAGLFGAVEDRVRIGERIRDPRLAPRDLEDPSGGAREVQSPSQVARGLRLFGPLQQAPSERRVGRVAARRDEVFAGGRNRPFRDVERRPGRQAPVERLPAHGAPRRCLGLAGRRGRSLVGMAVVDGEGVEVGYVSGEEANILVLGEGSGGRMRLGRRFVSGIVDRVTLRGPVAEIFAGLNVIDSDGEFVGIVRDTNEADDVLDSFIVEDESGEMVNVLLEDVRSIDEWVELSVAGDSLYEKG